MIGKRSEGKPHPQPPFLRFYFFTPFNESCEKRESLSCSETAVKYLRFPWVLRQPHCCEIVTTPRCVLALSSLSVRIECLGASWLSAQSGIIKGEPDGAGRER